jgi:hypothetical protein
MAYVVAGLANVGIGSLDASGKTDDFYEQVGQYAKHKGVVVSVISIKGGEVNFQQLLSLKFD